MKFFISRSGLEYITRHLDREKFYNLLSDRLKKLQNFEIEQKKEFFVSKFIVTVKEVNTENIKKIPARGRSLGYQPMRERELNWFNSGFFAPSITRR